MWRPVADVSVHGAGPGGDAGTVRLPARRGASAGAVLRASRVVLLMQLAWLMGFSFLQYERGALTFDYSIFDQARWLLTHGRLNPYDTVVGYAYWHSHGELLMWPLAQLTTLSPHGLLLLWLQDAAVVATAWVALSWVAEAAAASRWHSRLTPAGAIAVAAVLLVADPWPYWAAAFDFHFETVATCFALLAGRALWAGEFRRLWVWVALALSTGDVAGLYVLGVGLAGATVGPRQRRQGLMMAAAGVAWLTLLTFLHANRGSGLASGYGYLAAGTAGVTPTLSAIASGALHHPGRAVAQLWANRANVWANLSPSGILGVADPWGLALPGLVVVSSSLVVGNVFSAPGFQNFAAYSFVAVGTVFVLGRIGSPGRFARLRSVAVLPLAWLLAAVTLAWAVVWLPTYPGDWLTVSAAAGNALSHVRAAIPASAEVVASQGVSGRFASRPQAYAIIGTPDVVPVHASEVWFVLAPAQGIEMPVQATEAVLAQVADSLGAVLVIHEAGIWAFKWSPPTGTRSVTLQGSQKLVEAWTAPTATGTSVTIGPPAQWHLVGTGRQGYVVHGDYWFEPAGNYTASVRLASTGPTDVEVWNAATSTLLARRQLLATDGPTLVNIPFVQASSAPARVFHGVGPFVIHPVAPPPGQPVEIRVFDPGGDQVEVYELGIRFNSKTPG